MKRSATIILALAAGFTGGYVLVNQSARHMPVLVADPAEEPVTALNETPLVQKITIEPKQTIAGDYLSSIFAQYHHDWGKAGDFLNRIMKETPDEPGLPKRAMVLAMGTGDAERAIALAGTVKGDKEGAALADLFLAVGAFHSKDYTSAAQYIKHMPKGSLSDFIMPMLESWADAANGIYNVSKLNQNTIHIHHAVLISEFLGQKFDALAMLNKVVLGQEVTLEDVERIANIYAQTGDKVQAIKLYEKIVAQWPDNMPVQNKLAALRKGEDIKPIARVSAAEEGIAAALYDMGNLLFREEANDSALVFTHMALYLMPEMTNARILLAAIDERKGRYEQAIEAYLALPAGSEYYMEGQRKAAQLMEEAGDSARALTQLQTLVDQNDDVESMIKMGDIYRRQDNFKKAIEVYNKAAGKLGGKIPEEYWNLYYVRGMAYERDGQWEKAEADLKAALGMKPDHAYVLNYLSYAWAERGENLDQALEYAQKAVARQPEDGYIVDTLGWIYFRMGRFTEAIAQLERAVELMPYDPEVNNHLGDAYWRNARKREARFQWQRARNFSKDDEMIVVIDQKLDAGLPSASAMAQSPPPTQEAHSQPAETQPPEDSRSVQ